MYRLPLCKAVRTDVATFSANSSTNATANITVPTKTSDLTNDSGFITSDNTKIPLAGSNQISGSLIPATDGVYSLGSNSNGFSNVFSRLYCSGAYGATALASGNDIYQGGFVVVYSASGTFNPGSFGIYAVASENSHKELTGFPDGTLTWNGQPIQYGSDQRLKQQISEIDDKLLDAWEDVDLVQFKYNDAVDAKKDKARLHTGYVVQQIDSACKSHNVDISAYGLYCHEEYPEETEEVEVEQADGTKVKERKVIREASEHYSLRYTEVYAVECMYLRRCIARLTARIEQLEKEQEASK